MTDLQLPGAGLPPYERGTLSILIKVGSAISSDARALRRFERETDELMRLFEDDESYDPFEPLLIPRVIGIEDSSRKWSVAMVLDHVCKVNREMALAVDSLSKGVVPHGEIDVALYKPDPDIGFEVVEQFEQVSQGYVGTVEKILNSRDRLPTQPTFPHPWFGPLNAHQWHYLAAAHMWIHRRQAQKIIAMLGIT